VPTPLPIKRPQLDRALISKKGLHEFVRRAWHVVEPSTPFVDGPHIREMCAHLTAVSLGKCKRLVINVPPGFSKSLIVSVFWPAWHWAMVNGGTKWMHLSFDISLSLRDSGRCRELMASDWYQSRWGYKAEGLKREPIALAGQQGEEKKGRRKLRQEAASIFWTNQKGLRFSTMVKGRSTGWHCHIQVCDDPTKPLTIQTGGPAARAALEATEKTWKGTFASRTADPKDFSRVVIMQRLHAADLAATCIKEGYVHLCLPMEYDPDRPCKTPFGGDWRTEKGELLCPERMGAEEAAERRKALGSADYEAQYNQNPVAEGGTIFKPKWFTSRWRAIPGHATWWQSWDATFDGKTSSDYVVGQVWARANGLYYLVDQVRERMDFVTTCRAIQDMSAKWPQAIRVLVENKANGPAIMSVLKSKLPGLIPIEPCGGKEARARSVSPLCEAGSVLLPDTDVIPAPWVSELTLELCQFPLSKNDDQVDAFSQGLQHASEENAFMDNLAAAMDRINRPAGAGPQ
jgi:predicted phage terminase large subunit-like protein